MAEISELLGATLTQIDGKVGDDEMVFTLTDGRSMQLWHIQDCGEVVTVEDICGDLADLIGSPLVTAECVGNQDEGEDPNPAAHCDDSWTWTFYRLATAKGFVTIRWLGESNGYYSEEVDCCWLKEGADR